MDPLDPSLSERVALPDGARLFGPGEACSQFVRVVSGQVRVNLLTRSGRPIVLYRIEPGRTCTMTTMCLLGGDDYAAEAHTEGPTAIEVMGAEAFRRSMDADPCFRAQVFAALGERLAAMMVRFDEVTSVPVAARLANMLLSRADPDRNVWATHDALAADCGTSREVVSRKMAAWQREGLIERFRGGSILMDRERLRRIAEDCD